MSHDEQSCCTKRLKYALVVPMVRLSIMMSLIGLKVFVQVMSYIMEK